MSSSLATYIQDHLAGANAAIEIIGVLQKRSEELPTSQLLAWLAAEVQQDKETLEKLARNMGIVSSTVKDSAAWVGTRIVNLKIGAGELPFGAFEAREFLCLGIQGKLHLWKALQRSAACARVIDQPNFNVLMERALGSLCAGGRFDDVGV